MKNVTVKLEKVSYYQAYIVNNKDIIEGIKLVEPNGIITEINNRYIENLEEFTLQELMYKPFRKETKTNCICNGYNYLDEFVKILWLQVERITDREELETEDIFQKVYKKIITFEIDGKYTFEHVKHYTRKELKPLGVKREKFKKELEDLKINSIPCWDIDYLIKHFNITRKSEPKKEKFEKIAKKYNLSIFDHSEFAFTANTEPDKNGDYNHLIFKFTEEEKSLRFVKLNDNNNLKERLDLFNATEKKIYNNWQDAFKDLELFIKENLKDESTNK